MYPLNTTLIFTSLTQASAAADLFGEDALDTYGTFEGEKFEDVTEWRKGFNAICCTVDSINDPEKWRIILDTPEKVKWFEPQVGDLVLYFAPDDLMHFYQEHEVLLENEILAEHKVNIVKIIQRNSKPFPQPQDVKAEEETL